MQKARGHSFSVPKNRHRAPTACRHTVSGSISLPSKGFFSPFPHGTGALSVVCLYLALDNGLPRFRQDFSCPTVLEEQPCEMYQFRLRGHYPLWRTFPVSFGYLNILSLTVSPVEETRLSSQPHRCNGYSLLHTDGLGSSPFARRY